MATTESSDIKLCPEERLALALVELEQKTEYRGYMVADLRKVFDKMVDPEDRKNEISCCIPGELFAIASMAVEFFTSSKLQVVGSVAGKPGFLAVYASGHRVGPRGDC